MARFFVAMFIFTYFFSFPSPAFAQIDWESTGCIQKITNADGTISEVPTLNCLPVVFNNVVLAALMFAGIVALFFIILSGIKFISSSGDPKQVEGAKKTATYAIIGLLVVLLSFFVITVIGHVTGVECIRTFGFDSCT